MSMNDKRQRSHSSHSVPGPKDTHQQSILTNNACMYTEHTCTQLRFVCLCWPLVGSSLRGSRELARLPGGTG